MDAREFDLVVIGAGPGGYVAAIKSAQNGMKVALIERKELGGTCLNVGCIPTKTLIAGAHAVKNVRDAEVFGIKVGEWSFDFQAMKERKDRVVGGIRQGLEGLIKSNQIEIFRGSAKFMGPNEVKVLPVGDNTGCLIRTKKTIIATGSDPLDIPAFPCDHDKVVNSTSILEWTELPESLAVIGGGYIGCEFASLYAELGVKVTIFEMMPEIISLQGKTLSDALTRSFTKQGIEIRTGVKVSAIDREGDGIKVRLEGAEAQQFSKALVSVGRKFVSDGLDLEKTGIALHERGYIEVNEKMQTSVDGIYAIGDITGIAMLAHVASHQGVVAADNASGHHAVMHYNAVPAVIFTNPEIAMVGYTEEEAKEKGYSIVTGRFPFQALGKSVAANHPEGFAQIITDKNTGAIIGAQVVGYEASAIIGEMAIAIQNELTLDCLNQTVHAHPTIGEVWLEAGMMAAGTPIHLPPKRRPSHA